jgi:predicted RNase H-like HicB family nuclease
MIGIRYVTFQEYVREALKNANYESDKSLGNIPCVVAEVPALPGCVTQGENFEEARENLVDAIQLWVTAGLKEGEEMPVINGCGLAVSKSKLEDINKPEEILIA